MNFDAVGTTSLLVAAMRAEESERDPHDQRDQRDPHDQRDQRDQRDPKGGRLFVDPYARTLAGSAGFELLNRARAVVGDVPVIALRTRFIDDRVNEAIKRGIRQVVILAAGMDSRAFRLPFLTGTRLFELDRPEVLSYKAEKLADPKPRCERKTVAVDLREDWPNRLLQAGMDSSLPTLWLAEGLLLYLEEAVALSLFKKVSELAAPKSILLFDIFDSAVFTAPYMQKQIEFMKELGSPWRFGINEDVATFMQKFGWQVKKVVQPWEVAPERWPFPTGAPANAANPPRGGFVDAMKV